MNKLFYDVVVIGGGPAGMAAALSAHKEGSKTLIIERDSRLGGILNQCIHAGFGLHYFGEELTGTEYANRFVAMVEQEKIDVMVDSMVLSLTADRVVKVLSPQGYFNVNASAIVLAMGCRERTAGAIALTGTRPVGVYTAGQAQKLCNLDGYLVGKEVVVLGSGDIGLIMARRMTLEGAKVKRVIELMSYSSGLKRNIVQCLDDFDIPIDYSHTVTRLEGMPRLTGIYYAPVDEMRRPILAQEKYIKCDCLLLSVGLIPENDLLNGLNAELSPLTSGAVVNECRMTSLDGIFSCGNVLHVHDLVDNVSKEAELAGQSAARYASGKTKSDKGEFLVAAKDGVRYALPQRISRGEGEVKIFFRVGDVFKGKKLIVECDVCAHKDTNYGANLQKSEFNCVKCDDKLAIVGENDLQVPVDDTLEKKILYSKKCLILSPGEMESVTLDKSDIEGNITLRLE